MAAAAAAAAAASSAMRLATASFRSLVIRISSGVKTKATTSPFGISSRTPLTARIFRTPVELSGVSLVSMLLYHTATASELLKSMLSVAPHVQAWTLEDCKDDVWSKREFYYLSTLEECLILESE